MQSVYAKPLHTLAEGVNFLEGGGPADQFKITLRNPNKPLSFCRFRKMGSHHE